MSKVGLGEGMEKGPQRFLRLAEIITIRDDIRILKKWSLALSKGRIPILEGDLIDPTTKLPFRDRWSSSRILEGRKRWIRTKSGCEYTLKGPPYFSDIRTCPEYILLNFKEGFPRNWKELFERWQKDSSLPKLHSEESSRKRNHSEASSKMSCAVESSSQKKCNQERYTMDKDCTDHVEGNQKHIKYLDAKFQPVIHLKRLSSKRLMSRRFVKSNPFKNLSNNITSNGNSSNALPDTNVIMKEFQQKPKSVKQTRKNANILQQLNGNHVDNFFDLPIDSHVGKNTMDFNELFESDSDQDISVNTPRTPIIMNLSSDPDTEEVDEVHKSKKMNKFKDDAFIFRKSKDLKKGRKLLTTSNKEPISFRSINSSIERRKKLEKKAKLLTQPISHLLKNLDE
uniref:SANTA domain-containing protein n=1 Tax=Lepeophtheirus salmonis TaxID=72036 RepID=A0A0K2SZS7_LEPSM